MPEHIEEVDCTIHVGSRNVFADVGLPDPELRRAKALVSILMEKQIDHLAIPIAEAAARTGLTETELSRMVRGVNRTFGIGCMLDALAVLDAEGRADGEFCRAVRQGLVGTLEVLRGMGVGQEAHDATGPHGASMEDAPDPQAGIILSDRDYARFEEIMTDDAPPTDLAVQEAQEWAGDVASGRIVLKETESEAVLRELVRQAQELDMGY